MYFENLKNSRQQKWPNITFFASPITLPVDEYFQSAENHYFLSFACLKGFRSKRLKSFALMEHSKSLNYPYLGFIKG